MADTHESSRSPSLSFGGSRLLTAQAFPALIPITVQVKKVQTPREMV